jgi:hypothetical protein
MKEQLINGVKEWAFGLIDKIAPNNVLFALLNSTIKRGVGNMIEKYANYELLEPFLINSNGEVDVVATLDEILQSLRIMPIKQFSFSGGWSVEIGEGAISLHIPQNEIMGVITDNLKTVRITEKDIMELGEIINKQ